MNILYLAKGDIGFGVRGQITGLIKELRRKGHNAFLATEPGSDFEKRAWMSKIPLLTDYSGKRGLSLSVRGLEKAFFKQDIKLIHLAEPSLIKIAAKLKDKVSPPPVVVLSQWTGFEKIKDTLFRFVSAGELDQIIVSSRWLRNSFIGSDFAPSSLSLVPPGVDLIRFDYKIPPYKFYKEFNLPPEMLLIGCTNSLEDGKGHDILLEAAESVLKRVSEAVFLIAGDGKRKERIKREVMKRRMEEKFIFTGFRDDVPHILSALNLLVMPAVSEVFPVAILEAMAMAKPVVASQLPGITEVVADGGSGLFVPPGDVAALSEAIISILTNKSRLKSFGRQGRKIVEQSFDIKLVAGEMERIYHKLIDKRK